MNQKYAELYKEVALIMLPWHLAKRTDQQVVDLDDFIQKVRTVTERIYREFDK